MSLSKNYKSYDIDKIPAKLFETKIKVLLKDFRREFENTKIEIKEEPTDDQIMENVMIKVKKDQEGDFLTVQIKKPEIPNPIKKEIKRMKIKFFGGNIKFSNHQCEICLRYFSRKNNLKQHTTLHYKTDQIQHVFCDHCGLKFNRKGYLKRHLENFVCRNPKEFTCDHCGKKFNEKSKISEHIKIHTIHKVECGICKLQVKAKSLPQHMKARHSTKNEQVQCKICNKILKNFNYYKRHLKIHEEKNFACNFCNRKFVDQGLLNFHMKIHKNPEQFECHICRHQAKSKRGLLKHLKGHDLNLRTSCNFKQEKFECDCCGKDFGDKKSISRHLKRHFAHEVECEICHAKVKSSCLSRHMKLAHGQKNVECNICKKSFNHDSKLRKHLKVHDSIRFECQFCPNKFLSRGHLNQHMKFHNNPEKLKCQICGMQSKSKQKLKNHLKTHDKNREKNFKCNQCDFMTFDNYTLNQHLKYHKKQNEKLLKNPSAVRCKKCLVVFSSSIYYKAHFRNVHRRRNKFQCDLCGSTYLQKFSVERHLKTKHNFS